jgi:hypothetical protein
LISKFLEQGGSASDFVSILDNEVKVKTADVVVIFGAIESLLHNLAKRTVVLEGLGEEEQKSQKKFQQLALDVTRNILEDHVRYVGLY